MGSTSRQHSAVVLDAGSPSLWPVRSCFPEEAVALLLPVGFARFKTCASVSDAVGGEERRAQGDGRWPRICRNRSWPMWWPGIGECLLHAKVLLRFSQSLWCMRTKLRASGFGYICGVGRERVLVFVYIYVFNGVCFDPYPFLHSIGKRLLEPCIALCEQLLC